MSLNDLAKKIHDNAAAYGFYNSGLTFSNIISLCHSELSEALEEYRNNKPMVYFIDCESGEESEDFVHYEDEKPEGVAVEMIDCLIRILDWCSANKVDVDNIIRLKCEYYKKESELRNHRNKGNVL